MELLAFTKEDVYLPHAYRNYINFTVTKAFMPIPYTYTDTISTGW